MGRGNKAALDNGVSLRQSKSAEASYQWNVAAGAEATEEELESWLRDQGKIATIADIARQEWQDPSFIHNSGSISWRLTHYPSRRALEAAYALCTGIDDNEVKRMYADKSWSEMIHLCKEAGNQLHDGKQAHFVIGLASRLEYAARKTEAGLSYVPDLSREREQRLAELETPEIAIFKKRYGPGAFSGNPEDYTRSELRKLLGFLERECKHLTDDDLRAMALDAHLIPRWKGSPSKAELAAIDSLDHRAGVFAANIDWDLTDEELLEQGKSLKQRAFKRSMRQPYSHLIKRFRVRTGETDDGSAGRDTMLAALAEHHEFMRQLGWKDLDEKELKMLAECHGVSQTLAPEAKYAHANASKKKFQTSLELKYMDAIHGFTEQFGGAKKLGNVRSGLKDKSGRTRRNCLAYYSTDTGDVHMNATYVKQLGQPEKMTPLQVEQAASTLAHELFHAIESRDSGSSFTGRSNPKTAEHCLDEGATESLARIYAQDMAERMGIWDSTSQGPLREHADTGSYPSEVETVNALVAAACGELSQTKLRMGSYAQPEALSQSAQEFLLNMHKDYGPDARRRLLADILRSRPGYKNSDPDNKYDEDDALAKIDSILQLCKGPRFQSRWEKVPVYDDDGNHSHFTTNYMKPEKLSDVLGEAIKAIGF